MFFSIGEVPGLTFKSPGTVWELLVAPLGLLVVPLGLLVVPLRLLVVPGGALWSSWWLPWGSWWPPWTILRPPGGTFGSLWRSLGPTLGALVPP